ncbi:hypothetical protein ACIBCM_07290 [Streptomyces sp. NPDC051018]|uniref:hypothetical protein n=1 Tax=Streptomyces sp. NPDC051018 TaxID=3365639 RepID=UPI003793C7AE
MPTPVHALAHRPLTVAAVAELVGLPAEPQVPEAGAEAVVQRRGWVWEHSLVCDALVTGHGHVLYSDSYVPFGYPEARHFLVFGEVYPVDPDDEEGRNGRWLFGLMDDWRKQPGWAGVRPGTVQDCEDVLDRAARSVAECLGSAPERTIVSDAAVVTGPAMTHRVWRTPTHALVLGPAADNGPYGYLTHLQLSYTPLRRDLDLPPGEDADALEKWITARVDW